MEILAIILLWPVLAIIYFGPSILAVCRNHGRTKYIFIVNLLLGWTLVGLYLAFAWALSSARAPTEEASEAESTDFGECIFRTRNVTRQPDGGAIVYPAWLRDDAYWLNGAEFKKYLELRAAEIRRNFPRSLILLIIGIALFLAFRRWLGPESGTALALLVFTALYLLIAAWELVLRPRKNFLAAFPNAPTAEDTMRPLRRILAAILSFDIFLCAGATLLCAGLIVSIPLNALFQPGPLTIRAHDAVVLLISFALLGCGVAYFGFLTWHHLAFLYRHRRSPTQEDVDKLVAVEPTAEELHPAATWLESRGKRTQGNEEPPDKKVLPGGIELNLR
jgi:hypothetical protein